MKITIQSVLPQNFSFPIVSHIVLQQINCWAHNKLGQKTENNAHFPFYLIVINFKLRIVFQIENRFWLGLDKNRFVLLIFIIIQTRKIHKKLKHDLQLKGEQFFLTSLSIWKMSQSSIFNPARSSVSLSLMSSSGLSAGKIIETKDWICTGRLLIQLQATGNERLLCAHLHRGVVNP